MVRPGVPPSITSGESIRKGPTEYYPLSIHPINLTTTQRYDGMQLEGTRQFPIRSTPRPLSTICWGHHDRSADPIARTQLPAHACATLTHAPHSPRTVHISTALCLCALAFTMVPCPHTELELRALLVRSSCQVHAQCNQPDRPIAQIVHRSARLHPAPTHPISCCATQLGPICPALTWQTFLLYLPW